jgi:RES domain-containing protein
VGKLLLRVFRLVKPEHGGSVREAFSGLGGLYGDGRWHYQGAMIVYTSASLSLALLETRVHWRPGDFTRLHQFTGEVPDEVLITLRTSDLPEDWRLYPPAASTRRLGTRWFQAKQSVGLRVPSVIVPEEENCLLNPFHDRFRFEWFSGPVDYPLDPRLVSGQG